MFTSRRRAKSGNATSSGAFAVETRSEATGVVGTLTEGYRTPDPKPFAGRNVPVTVKGGYQDMLHAGFPLHGSSAHPLTVAIRDMPSNSYFTTEIDGDSVMVEKVAMKRYSSDSGELRFHVNGELVAASYYGGSDEFSGEVGRLPLDQIDALIQEVPASAAAFGVSKVATSVADAARREREEREAREAARRANARAARLAREMEMASARAAQTRA
jgi:hypothetical protein